MSKFVHSFQAQKDLDEIWHYIALDNILAADKLIDAIAEKCSCLSSVPEMGEKRPDLSDALRCFSVGNYVMFFVRFPKELKLCEFYMVRVMRKIF